MRKLLQPLLMFFVVMAAIGFVATTLRGRPRLKGPVAVHKPYQSADFQLTRARMNQALAHLAESEAVEVAPAAPIELVTRRLSLALVGSGLSLEEMRAIEPVAERDRLAWLTERFLADRRWADYFAERFSRAFVGTNDGPFLLFRRRKFNAWLADQFQKNVGQDKDAGYDKLVRGMLSAKGLWTDTPPVNFVTATMDEADERRGDPIRLAGRASRAFLAQRMDCLQCHDDFLNQINFGSLSAPRSGTQRDFHALAAFFSGTSLPDPVFSGIREDGRQYVYEFLGESEATTVEPEVPFAQELLPLEGESRWRLAAWVTHPDNRAFSRATVNRVWALVFSRPLVAPVDNIPLDDSVPPVLDILADDFALHGFDIKRLIRLIVQSDAFQRDSRAEFTITPAHEAAWAVFPITQLRPEQVAGSISQASSLTAIDSHSSVFKRLQMFGDGQEFLRSFGDRGEDEFDSDSVTITQRLVLMNGKLVRERTKIDLIANASTRISQMVPDNEAAIGLAFLTLLNRRPSDSELKAFVEHLTNKSGDDRSRAISDVYWAMINSTEFSWNH